MLNEATMAGKTTPPEPVQPASQAGRGADCGCSHDEGCSKSMHNLCRTVSIQPALHHSYLDEVTGETSPTGQPTSSRSYSRRPPRSACGLNQRRRSL